MHRPILTAIVAITAVLSPCGSSAQTSYPMLLSAYPVGICRGRSTEVIVASRFTMFGAYRILVEGTGVSGSILTPAVVPVATMPAANPSVLELKIRFDVAADAILGPREFRICTAQGASSVGVVLITDAPSCPEVEPNNAADAAQTIELPAALNGRIQAAEDVDCFRFRARAGEWVSFVMHSARLQDKIHDLQEHADPILVLFDSQGREIAGNDDYYRADPLLAVQLPSDGDYVLQVRDVRYKGNASWTYCVRAARGPHVRAAFPLALQRGTARDFQAVGIGTAGSTLHVAATTDSPSGPLELAFGAPIAIESTGGGPFTSESAGDTSAGSAQAAPALASSVRVLVTDTVEQVEREPNDTVATAQSIAIPCGVSGRLHADNDQDVYQFSAKKGDTFTFGVAARTFDSAMDSFATIVDASDRELANSDDTVLSTLTSKDSRLDWTAPADGEFALRVRDLHSRGGDAYFYHLTAERAEPDFALECDGDRAMLGPGGCTAWFVRVTRQHGFAGDVSVQVDGLPRGVSAAPVRIPAAMQQACIVLTAEPGSPLDAAAVNVVGTATIRDSAGNERIIRRHAVPLQEIYLPGGGRGYWPVRLHTVATMDQADVIGVEVSRRTITLAPGERATIDVNVKRSPGYTKPINLDLQFKHLARVYGDPLPPGVALDPSSKTLIGENGTRGTIVLQAAANAAPVENLSITVLAHVSINFVVKTTYASAPITLTIAPRKPRQTPDASR